MFNQGLTGFMLGMGLSVCCNTTKLQPTELMDGEVPATHFDSPVTPCASNRIEFNFEINRGESKQSDVKRNISLHT